MTPQWSQWLCCDMHSRVSWYWNQDHCQAGEGSFCCKSLQNMFKSVFDAAESMTPLCMSQQSQWLRWNFSKFTYLHSRVNDSAVHITAESMTRLCTSKQSHWLRCDKTWRLQGRFSRQILIHIDKGFNSCPMGPRWSCLVKKPEVENLVSGSL
jgi:hypothetical protein